MNNLNIETDNSKYFWSIFKIEREVSGKYLPDYSVDTLWINKQMERVTKYKPKKIVIIMADFFAETVYNINDLAQLPGNKLPGIELILESTLIDKYWNKPEYQKVMNDTKPSKTQLNKEAVKRKDMYNSMNYTISDREATRIAKSALGCFKAEEILMNKIIMNKT